MSKSQGHDDVAPGPGLARRGTAVAATALAAVLLMGVGLIPASATEPPPHAETGVSAPEELDPDVAARLVGVAEELAEAVTHGEMTEEQAKNFLLQVRLRIER
ncbi:hypothetical protein ACH9EU_14685 [Kocuria sp. M1R5S2]|uniref:hypothetical protein n=1 Tax=Kocuria rhizosphaerae TaxID=3376285 RepID=UPI00378ADFB7